MSTTLATLIASCAPLVHPTTMHALVRVESAANPYAVSINRPKAQAANGNTLPAFRQPRTAAEAQRIVRALHTQGFTTSVGLAQINTEHLQRLGLNLTALLDPCTNLTLAQSILLDCERVTSSTAQAPRLHRILSCYNSGNATTGIRNGYTHRVASAALKNPLNNPNRSNAP
jgi:type IV secretion system protein VirB1